MVHHLTLSLLFVLRFDGHFSEYLINVSFFFDVFSNSFHCHIPKNQLRVIFQPSRHRILDEPAESELTKLINDCTMIRIHISHGQNGEQSMNRHFDDMLSDHHCGHGHDQVCKFVCLMSDMSFSPSLSCLSFLRFEKVIVWIDRLSVDRISSETDDR
jgi:hypothetical protein